MANKKNLLDGSSDVSSDSPSLSNPTFFLFFLEISSVY